MTRRKKAVLLALALALLGVGSTLFALAHRTQPGATGQPLDWPLAVVILLSLLGLAGVVGAMAVFIAALLPDVLRGPDAHELTQDNSPPPKPLEE